MWAEWRVQGFSGQQMYQPQHAAKAGGASPEPRVFCFGEKVQYLSRRTGQWIPAVVQGHAMVAVPGAGTPEEFHYQLDVQEAAHPSRVRAAESQPKQATTPAPALSVPVAQPCKESQQHPVEQLHQPTTNLPQQSQPPPAPLPPPASAPAPLCPVRSATAPISKQPPARWQLMCLYAEGFSQEVLHALPSTMRALPIPDGKSHLGRQHQAKFLEALLVKSPQLLSIISRTHADVEAPANSSKVRFTNLTLNPVFVNSVQALWQGQSGELGPGTTLSFARNQGDDTPHHFLIFQLQALDAGLECLQSSAETETKVEAREHQPPSAAAMAIPPAEQPPLPQPPPSAMAMTTVDVAKVAIPTEVLQQLRAVETCKLDSPKPKEPPREPSPDPRSDQVSKVPPEPRSFLQSMDKEKKADPQPQALQPKGQEPSRAALGAVDAKAGRGLRSDRIAQDARERESERCKAKIQRLLCRAVPRFLGVEATCAYLCVLGHYSSRKTLVGSFIATLTVSVTISSSGTSGQQHLCVARSQAALDPVAFEETLPVAPVPLSQFFGQVGGHDFKFQLPGGEDRINRPRATWSLTALQPAWRPL